MLNFNTKKSLENYSPRHKTCDWSPTEKVLDISCSHWLITLVLMHFYFFFSAKPIDLLAQYVSVEDDDLEVQMHEPYKILVVSGVPG